MSVKVSHEVPLCLLEWSKGKMDYQYALVHLLEENDEYREHFMSYRKEKGSYIILDNSLHELGEAYNDSGLLKWVEELRPDEFIIPDVWENRDISVVNAKKWSKIDLPKEVTKVAVVQATTLHEAATCYQTYKDLGYKKIAFSYGASYYNDVVTHPNKDLGKALGRISIISTLLRIGVISQTDRIHLLGCASPFEFSLYKGFDCIESIDTSNPVMAGLEGTRYNSSLTIDKPKANMNNYFDISIEDVDIDLIEYNINQFKNFIK
jgi:hypothetical protein